MYKKAIDYLPHEKPMVFLDDVVEISDTSCTCTVNTNKDGLLSAFLNPDGCADALLGIEMMAQCTGVWSGYHILMRHEELSMGMLVGISNVILKSQSISANTKLYVTANVLIENGTFGSFECQVKDDSNLIISSIINTYKMDS